MILTFCAVCGTSDDLHQHHINPVVFSRIKRTRKKGYDPSKKLKDCTVVELFANLFDRGIISQDETITLCFYHHNIFHGVVRFNKINHSDLIKEGMRISKLNGTKIGRPEVSKEIVSQIKELRSTGMGINKIAKTLRTGVGTVSKAVSNIMPQ